MQPLTLLDPLTYGVEGIRYGLTGTSQINPGLSFIVLAAFSVVMTVVGAGLFRKMSI